MLADHYGNKKSLTFQNNFIYCVGPLVCIDLMKERHEMNKSIMNLLINYKLYMYFHTTPN